MCVTGEAMSERALYDFDDVIGRTKAECLRVADVQVDDFAPSSSQAFSGIDNIANGVVKIGSSSGWNNHQDSL